MAAPASSSAAPGAADVRRELERVRRSLYGSVLPFWLRYSVDALHGGFFNNLGRHGEVFDERKHVWLQARQCWLFARVANAHPREGQLEALFERYAAARPRGPARTALAEPQPLTRAALVAAARAGVAFLVRHAVDPASGHVAFALTREGAVALHQRKMFSASFLVMALGETARCCAEPALFEQAVELLRRMLDWARFPASLGKAAAPGAAPLEPLNVHMVRRRVAASPRTASFHARARQHTHTPLCARARTHCRAMLRHPSLTPALGSRVPRPALRAPARAAPQIILNVCAELATCIPAGSSWAAAGGAPAFFAAERAAAAARIAAHACAERRCVFEHVVPGRAGADRFDMGSPDGRLCNPGHAIEAGWFLLEHAQAAGDAAAEALARDVIDWSWLQGWDASRGGGGFVYFVDAGGHSPTQLEASMKLWWPVNEAMIALARTATLADADAGLGAAAGGGFARYVQCADWAFSHLADEEGGEWYGYCSRDGEVTHSFKGGPYKGCLCVAPRLGAARRRGAARAARPITDPPPPHHPHPARHAPAATCRARCSTASRPSRGCSATSERASEWAGEGAAQGPGAVRRGADARAAVCVVQVAG